MPGMGSGARAVLSSGADWRGNAGEGGVWRAPFRRALKGALLFAGIAWVSASAALATSGPNGAESEGTSPRSCPTPDEGCACDTPGESVECGSIHSRVGNRVSCIVGERRCQDGAWGACSYPGGQIVRTVNVSSPTSDSGVRARSVSTGPSPCVGNPCDPRCAEFHDSRPETGGAASYDAGAVFLEPDGGAETGPLLSCAGASPSRPEVTFRFLVQSTPSMAGARSGLAGALTEFAAGAPGLVAGLDYFPVLGGASRCDSSEYEDAYFQVPVGRFPGAGSAQLLDLEAALVEGAELAGEGYPTLSALNGALSSAAGERTRTGADQAVVLITDGIGATCSRCAEPEPAACAADKLRGLVADYYQRGVRTYVFSVDTGREGAQLNLLNGVARAGSGGERDAFTVASGEATHADVSEALVEVQNRALSCEWAVPPPANGVPDPASFSAYLKANGGTTRLTRYSSLGACGDHQGFVMDTVRHTALLCPASCAEASSDFLAELDVQYECRGACTSGSAEAALVPVDMFAMMDRSGSMELSASLGQTRWQAASSALVDYANSREAQGNGFAMGYFPYPTDCFECRDSGRLAPVDYCWWGYGQWQATACDATRSDIVLAGYDRNDCSWESFHGFADQYGLQFGVLSGPGGAQARAQENSLSQLDGIQPEYNTDTYSAVRAAIELAEQHQSAHPDRKAVALLITDGMPDTACVRTNQETFEMTVDAAAAAYQRGIETYVIGVGPNLSLLDHVALAGSGGTQLAFLADVDQASIVRALSEVQQVSMPCWFPVPDPGDGRLDYSSPSVILTSAPGQSSLAERVNDASECGSDTAWYYDDNDAPLRVHLCPAACSVARAGGESRVDLEYRCMAGFDAGSVVFEYDGDSACNGNEAPVWGDWSWLSDTPGDSSIRFYVQSGNRDSSGWVSGLSEEQPLEFTAYEHLGSLACASAAGVCEATSTERAGRFADPTPRPGEVQVGALLKRRRIPAGNYLRIRAELLPSEGGSQAPTLREWHLDMTCEENQ